MDAHSIQKHRRGVATVLLILGIVLGIGWPIAIVVSWQHIISSHTRLGYLVGDLGLVTPLCFLSWYALTRARPWGASAFLFTAGALAYDVVHFGIYLIQEKFLNIPGIVYVLLILVSLGVLAWLSLWEIRVAVSAKAGREEARTAEGMVSPR